MRACLRFAIVMVVASAVLVIEGGMAAAATTASQPPTGIVARLSLPSRTIRSGSHLRASITTTNNTGHAVEVGACHFVFQVGWASKAVTVNPNWQACAGSFTIPAGRSVWPVSVGATYNLCSENAPGTRLIPRCLAGNRQPPLPPGYYRLTVYSPTDATIQLPTPIKMHVVAASTHP